MRIGLAREGGGGGRFAASWYPPTASRVDAKDPRDTRAEVMLANIRQVFVASAWSKPAQPERSPQSWRHLSSGFGISAETFPLRIVSGYSSSCWADARVGIANETPAKRRDATARGIVPEAAPRSCRVSADLPEAAQSPVICGPPCVECG